jgi:hypothetical protein
MAEFDRAEHHVLGQFARLALDHQHAFLGAGEHEVEQRRLGLLGGRVQDVLPVDVGNAGGADRTEERDAGQRQRRRTADQRDDVRVVFQVVAEDGGDDLHLVAEPLREQRADRAVDQAGDEGLVLAGAAFALEEAARNLAGREGFFLVVDGEREEILPRLLGAHADGGAEHDGVAVADQHGAVGLARDFAGFEDELAAAPVEFLAEVVEHHVILVRVRNANGRQEDDPWVAAGNGVSGCMGADCRTPGSRETMWPEAPSRPPSGRRSDRRSLSSAARAASRGFPPLGVAPRHHGAGAASTGVIWGRPADRSIGGDAPRTFSGAG